MSIFMVISGTLCGLEEEAVAFYPIMCPIFIAMGYDAIVTMGVPFTEGVWWRIGGCIVGSAVVIGYLYWYAKNQSQSRVFLCLGRSRKVPEKMGRCQR
ncbi:hypothetical protein [Mobiluncus mulieris]|uniref:hypothetical protein n=1 Tax=Mobiluncus mulieris TaxID=2052 RepID=UPI00201D4C88|nr:hypothetical protein [Mobiluncus mulieris]